MGAPTCPPGFTQMFMADPPDPATGCDYQCVRDVPPFDVISATCDAEPVDDCYVSTACNCTTTNCHDLGKECCAPTRTCVDFVTPPCTVELNCIWSPNHCDFLCDNPSCPPGQTWNGPPLCRCVTDTPDCDPPNVFCAQTNTCFGPPPEPACSDELGCEWNTTNCAWECGVGCPCPTNWTWDSDWCMCVPPDEFPPITDCCRCTAANASDPPDDLDRPCAEFEHSISPWNICPRLYRTSSDESVRGVRVERHCYQSGAYPPPNNWVCGTCPPGWWACGGGGAFACPGATFMCVHPLGWLRSAHARGKCLEFGQEPECFNANQPWSSSHPYWCECGGTEDGTDDLGGKEPCNLENSVGQYYSAWRDQSRIRFNRAETTTPPYDLTGIIAEPPAGYVYGEPTFVQDWRHRHILLFSKLEKANPTNVSVMEIVSDDDGKTWSEPTTVFTGARKPRIEIHPSTGAIVRAAYLPGSPATVGTLKASIQYPGDSAPGTEFTIKEYVGTTLIDLRVKDEGFHLAPAADGPGRWLLICTREGESSPADLQSWDECKTFTAANT